MSNLLMLSNSTMHGTGFFNWPRPWVKDFLGADKKKLLFIPYAAVTFSFDQYENNVREVFGSMGYGLESIHHHKNKYTAIEQADGIVVGGGNTFALLSRLYSDDVVEGIKQKISNGIPYIGWSAGANLACPSIMTTNDMPVMRPLTFDALNLVPFQINPHYHELKFENQGGETRIQRLEEFLVMNPLKKVIGLPEGMLLQRNGNTLVLRGNGVAKLFESGKEVSALKADEDLSYLLK